MGKSCGHLSTSCYGFSLWRGTDAAVERLHLAWDTRFMLRTPTYSANPLGTRYWVRICTLHELTTIVDRRIGLYWLLPYKRLPYSATNTILHTNEESTMFCLRPIFIYIPHQSCINCLTRRFALMAIRAVMLRARICTLHG